jgi:hypothetical protein
MWKVPKTNWKPTDYINYEDYNRIQGNLQHIADEFTLAIQSYTPQDEDDLPHAEKWNIAEDNLEQINQLTYAFKIGSKKQFRANQNYIDYEELNRLESAISKIHYVYLNQLENGKHLSFSLGGTKIFDCPRGSGLEETANANVMGNRLAVELGEERGEYND